MLQFSGNCCSHLERWRPGRTHASLMATQTTGGELKRYINCHLVLNACKYGEWHGLRERHLQSAGERFIYFYKFKSKVYIKAWSRCWIIIPVFHLNHTFDCTKHYEKNRLCETKWVEVFTRTRVTNSLWSFNEKTKCESQQEIYGDSEKFFEKISCPENKCVGFQLRLLNVVIPPSGKSKVPKIMLKVCK